MKIKVIISAALVLGMSACASRANVDCLVDYTSAKLHARIYSTLTNPTAHGFNYEVADKFTEIYLTQGMESALDYLDALPSHENFILDVITSTDEWEDYVEE